MVRADILVPLGTARRSKQDPSRPLRMASRPLTRADNPLPANNAAKIAAFAVDCLPDAFYNIIKAGIACRLDLAEINESAEDGK